MEETELPTIGDMYNCTRENHDYNAIRKYQGRPKNFAVSCKPTKKSHYLDIAIRLNCSPGPANTANHQEAIKKTAFQCKRAEKATFLDEIDHQGKKLNFPSPNHYQVTMPWPKKKDKLKYICEKINFSDSCQYEGDKTPGPGNYNIRTHPTEGKSDKKWTPHQVLKEREVIAAEVATYKPCPLQYNTFQRYELHRKSSHPTLKKQLEHTDKKLKENHLPGPGSYSTLCFWEGKEAGKKNESNYFKHISKAPSPGIYR